MFLILKFEFLLVPYVKIFLILLNLQISLLCLLSIQIKVLPKEGTFNINFIKCFFKSSKDL